MSIRQGACSPGRCVWTSYGWRAAAPSSGSRAAPTGGAAGTGGGGGGDGTAETGAGVVRPAGALHPAPYARRGTHWRASGPAAVRGWNVAVFGAGHMGPAQLAPLHRALRKSFEDAKNEPGAADFS
ncbi:hypothetical protein GCM10009863_44310 [Streptomyces axinellae]|uniref:Uncharacterized protein n=1 Tax=Streptomyces axinellae TaxID=552788 RepID=A0ABP6CUM4_9ACTN